MASAGQVAGFEATLSVRPERVTLHGEPPGLPATVVERVFRGSVEQYTLRTAGGLDLTAVVAGGSGVAAGPV